MEAALGATISGAKTPMTELMGAFFWAGGREEREEGERGSRDERVHLGCLVRGGSPLPMRLPLMRPNQRSVVGGGIRADRQRHRPAL